MRDGAKVRRAVDFRVQRDDRRAEMPRNDSSTRLRRVTSASSRSRSIAAAARLVYTLISSS
ncbi:MAG: hypothetical protein E6G39_11645 [Actinobacteria bacterium]|nr:MAG: hypothetical protein E6G39_11645 [Actinomycetota bacterium]